jgi:L-glyceraldehyde 3-phosphate reductase
MTYQPANSRYVSMRYRRCGRSGLLLPAISLGLWHNFGGVDSFENSQAILRRAFDLGITHFDLANNYGPPPGSAEENFGRMMQGDFAGHRDELIISTKAGYTMWDGPYGDWGSRKYLLSSLDQSLKRMKLSYVDILYSHRPDPKTPIEETMSALDYAVRSGKALYAAISNYDPAQTQAASQTLNRLGTPCLIHQPKYSVFERSIESGLLDVLGKEGIGCIAFCPLAQGLLTNRYLDGIPVDSRAGKPNTFLKKDDVTERRISQVRALNQIANSRGQSVAQLALAWVLRDPRMTTALIGASRVEQVQQNVAALDNLHFSPDELAKIESILA